MSVHRNFHHHFVPSHHNSYRPHMLRKQWLFFFVAVIMLSEGAFVSGLYVDQTQTVAYAEQSNLAAASASNSLVNSIGRELTRAAADSRSLVPWILGLIAVLLTIGVLLAFFVHIQIQQSEMLYSGALVAMFAFSLMLTDIHMLGML